MNLVLSEISNRPEDIERLTHFYNEVYVPGFPDPDERESLCNMKKYLKLREEDWYGSNNYHIILGFDGDRAVAGSVSDYLATPNCGVIEFLLVDRSAQGTGNGRKVHDATLKALDADARRNGRDAIDGIVIELNDPFRVASQDDNFDPFERALIWDRWGYGRLCFPYVQPALSDKQEPVICLLLAMKPVAPNFRHKIPPSLVSDVLREYMRWAMRIEKPEVNRNFIEMSQFLSGLSMVPVEPLSHYIGRDPDKPLSIRPITSATDPALKIATDLYQRVFPPGPTVIDAQMFGHALEWFVDRQDVHYHFWALAPGDGEPIAGMASFFVMPRFAFGGYLALEPPLKGTGRAGVAMKRIEEQIIRDEPEAQKFYAECIQNSTEEAILAGLGFNRVPARYYQPPTVDDQQFGTGRGPELTLLIKWLGCDYGRTQLSRDDFLADLKIWLVEVYRVSDPEGTHTFQAARTTFGG
jgi:GNAT superfamily N-acetyltransferase